MSLTSEVTIVAGDCAIAIATTFPSTIAAVFCGAGGSGGRGGRGGSGGVGFPPGLSGHDGRDGWDGHSGIGSAAGTITVSIDPQAQGFADRLHFANRNGDGAPGSTPIVRIETVSPIW